MPHMQTYDETCHRAKTHNLLQVQVGKAELLEVAPMQFLSELGVVPPALHKNKEGQVKGNVFYKLNK